MPTRIVSSAMSIFTEAVINQSPYDLHCVFSVLAGHRDVYFRALRGSQHQKAHDALAVHFVTIFLNHHIRQETISRLNQLCSGTRMQAQTINNFVFHFFYRHSVPTFKTVAPAKASWTLSIKPEKGWSLLYVTTRQRVERRAKAQNPRHRRYPDVRNP